MKASVIIAAYNEKNSIGQVLESILKQSEEAEVIVVDDGSTDGTTEVVSQYPVRLIRVEHKGPSEARNIGIKNSTGDVIFLVDADEILSENYIRVCMEDFEDTDVIAIFPNYEPCRKRINTLIGRCYFVEAIFHASQGPSTIPKVIKKAFLIEDLGLFDPELAYLEDTDLFLRMKKRAFIKGLKLIKEPNATVYHIIETPKRLNIKNIYRRSVHRSQAYIPFIVKHPKEGIKSIILPRVFLLLFPVSIIFYFSSLSWVKYVFLAHIFTVAAMIIYFISKYITVSREMIPSLCLPLIYTVRLIGSVVGVIKYLMKVVRG